MTLLLTGQRRANVRLCPFWLRNSREPQLPKFAIGRGSRQLIVMLVGQWLQPNSESLKANGINRDHSGVLLNLETNKTISYRKAFDVFRLDPIKQQS